MISSIRGCPPLHSPFRPCPYLWEPDGLPAHLSILLGHFLKASFLDFHIEEEKSSLGYLGTDVILWAILCCCQELTWYSQLQNGVFILRINRIWTLGAILWSWCIKRKIRTLCNHIECRQKHENCSNHKNGHFSLLVEITALASLSYNLIDKVY